MKKRTIIAASLILGISASSVFAENSTLNVEQRNDTFKQSRDNALGLSSTSADLIWNTRNLIADAKSKRNRTYGYKTKMMPKMPVKKDDTPKTKKPKPKPTGNRPEKTFGEKLNGKNKKGDKNPNKLSEKDSKITKKSTRGNSGVENLSKQNTRLYRLIYNAKNLERLTPNERAKVIKMHERILKTPQGQNVLLTIQKGEGGGLLVIVGEGKGKSKLFKQKMRNLNTNTHPANQFPKGMRCFFHSKYGCSTAAGFYQITKTNFDKMVKYLGIKDFSEKSQQIMALELMRTGKAKNVRGNYKGRGYVELLKGNTDNAIRYGTNDWASSRFSEWGGAKADYLGISRQIAKEQNKKRSDNNLKDGQYFQSWLDEFESESTNQKIRFGTREEFVEIRQTLPDSIRRWDDELNGGGDTLMFSKHWSREARS
ncbi:MAG TPA: hypothetical protein PKE69_06235 [Pyrinomonadaceae bacterium]|nr:hypothetical protein [Pyrinomonadaceae bacterium]